MEFPDGYRWSRWLGEPLVRLVIEERGLAAMDRDLLRFETNLADPVLTLAAIAEGLRLAMTRQFDTQGANSGGWAPLKQATVDEKVKKGLDPRILRASERLRYSLIRKFDPDHIEQPLSSTSLRFGSRVPYGIYHQTGTSRMPARPPLALSAADRVMLVKAAQRAIIAGVRGV